MQTGVPAKPAANVARLAPGFEPSFSAAGFCRRGGRDAGLGLAGELAHRPPSRRRSGKAWCCPPAARPCAGCCVMTLWLPVLDYARSYAPVVRGVMRHIDQPGCVDVFGLSPRPDRGVPLSRPHGSAARQPRGHLSLAARSRPSCSRSMELALDMRGWRLVATHPAPGRRQRQRAPVPKDRAAGELNCARSPGMPATVLVGQLAVMAFGVTDTIVAGRYSRAGAGCALGRLGGVHQRLRRR